MLEIVPKPSSKHSFWFNLLFYSSIGLVVLSGLAFLLLNFFNQKTADRLSALEKDIARERKVFEPLEKEVLPYQKKLNDFTLLLSDYRKPLNFLPVLERLTHPEIQFTQLSLSPKDSKAGLAGEGSIIALYQQLSILKRAPEIKDIQLSRFSLGAQGENVTFSIMLFLDANMFK